MAQVSSLMSRSLVNRTSLFIPTLKEVPIDAAISSHQLLLRAGYMRKSSNGVYMLLPLAQRVLSKLEAIIDEEMEMIGCNKMAMPSMIDSKLWKKSGRWETAGPELMKLKDRKGSDYCLGPTHEEMFTSLVADEVSSHRHLPLRLYQIGRKFRDERRPRFGLLRSREFVMKDLYTFDRTEEDAHATYREVQAAYHRVFARLDCPYVQVEADSGAIGGSLSHEFHLLSDVGEDVLLCCPCCGYAANQEKAEGFAAAAAVQGVEGGCGCDERGDGGGVEGGVQQQQQLLENVIGWLEAEQKERGGGEGEGCASDGSSSSSGIRVVVLSEQRCVDTHTHMGVLLLAEGCEVNEMKLKEGQLVLPLPASPSSSPSSSSPLGVEMHVVGAGGGGGGGS